MRSSADFFADMPHDCIRVISEALSIKDAAALAMTSKLYNAILHRATTKRYLQSMALADMVDVNGDVFCITRGGQVFARGGNYYGSLGLGDLDYREHFEKIPELAGVRQIVDGGRAATLFVTAAGEVYSAGNVRLYPLYPLPFIQPSVRPSKVVFDKKVIKVVMDRVSHGFLTDEGGVYFFGKEGFGEFGRGLVEEVRDIDVPTPIPNMPPMRDIVYTGAELFMLTTNNLLYVCGDNRYGELGLGHRRPVSPPIKVPLLTDIKSIEADQHRVYALTFQGRVYAWGDNDDGWLGFNDANQHNTPQLLEGINNIVSMHHFGDNHFFITAEANVYGFGENRNGELGVGDKELRTTPVLIPGLRGIKNIYCDHSVVFFQTHENHLYAAGKVFVTQVPVFNLKPEMISDCPTHDLIEQMLPESEGKRSWRTRDGVRYVSDREYPNRVPRVAIRIPWVTKILGDASLADLLYYSEGESGYASYCYQLALQKIQAAVTAPQILEVLPLLAAPAWNNCADIKAILPGYQLILAYANDRANQRSAQLVAVAWSQLVAMYRRFAGSQSEDSHELRDFMGALHDEVMLKNKLTFFLPPQSARRSNQALIAQLQADPVALRVAARFLLAELPQLEAKRKAEEEPDIEPRVFKKQRKMD